MAEKTLRELKRKLTHQLREGLSKDYDALYVKEYSTMWETERFLRKSELNIMNLDNSLNVLLRLMRSEIEAAIRESALTDEQMANSKTTAYNPDYDDSQLFAAGIRAIAAAQLNAALAAVEKRME